MTLKKYVISMAESPRTEKFMAQSFGKDFEVFTAADGRKSEVREQFSVEAFKTRYDRDPKPGEIGCAVSHYAVMKKFISESQPGDYALIAEDDAVFVSNASEIIFNIFSKIPLFDVIALGYPFSPGGYRVLSGLDELEHRPSIFSKDVGKSLDGRYRVSTYEGTLWGTGCYLISYEAAKRYTEFVEACGSIHWVADDWNYYSGPVSLKVRVLKPALVGWLGGSEIRDDDDAPMTFAELQQRPLCEKLALKARVKYFPRAFAAGLRDLADKIAKIKI